MSFRYKNGATYSQQKRIEREFKKEVQKQAELHYKKTKGVKVVEGVVDMACQVLHDEWGFGDKRLSRFKNLLLEQVALVEEGYVSLEDFSNNFKMIEK